MLRPKRPVVMFCLRFVFLNLDAEYLRRKPRSVTALSAARNDHQIKSAAAKRRSRARASMRSRNPINANKPTASIAAFIWTNAKEKSTDNLR
jgi:hypothetical protein